MTPKNSYATLTEFKEYLRSRNGSVRDDITDDGTMEDLLVNACRYIDSKTTRFFYPLIETTYYDTPGNSELWFDADVLEILTLTNGDATSITASDYNVVPRNSYPRYGLKLKGSSSIVWEADSDGNTESVISLVSMNGYHNRYAGAWEVVTTLAEDLDTSEVGFDLTSAASFVSGHIIRIGNEINIVDSKATNTVTVLQRGDNGSTAATHLTGASVSIWRPMEDCRNACIELAVNMYNRRFGTGGGEAATVTGAGVVLAPKDIPTLTKNFIDQYTRLV